MRIRRRPQPLTPSPSPYPPPQQASSDPSTAPPPNLHHCLPRYKEEEELHLYSPDNVDLADEPSPSPSPATRRAPMPPSHPQGDNPEQGRGGGAQRQGAAANGHGVSLENGRRDERDWPATNATRERLANGSAMPATLAASTVPKLKVKDGPKRRRGPAVLLEGSRCSRVNGRGWRCSQPTLVGYSLCEHHLGKGRQSRSGRSVAGVPKLGRTEPAGSGRKKDAAAALALAVAADAAEPAAAQLING